MAPVNVPGLGSEPESVTATVPVAPAASVMLFLSTVGFTPALRLAVPDWVPGATATASVTELPPRFVMESCLLSPDGAEDKTPKPSVGGLTTTGVLTAAPASSLPAPIHSTSTIVPESSVVTSCLAVFTSALLICAGVHV